MGSPLAPEITPAAFQRRLDAIDLYPVGGALELRGYVRPNVGGIALDYSHRISTGVSAFATAYGEASTVSRPEFGAVAGVRVRW